MPPAAALLIADEPGLLNALAPLQSRLAAHPLYASIRSLADLQTFMQSHVYAVWDFMSLLKSLQRALTCVDVPWVPSANLNTRRLINGIVLGEESDEYEGEGVSHFELYLRAMRECGAATGPAEALIARLTNGAEEDGPSQASSRSSLPTKPLIESQRSDAAGIDKPGDQTPTPALSATLDQALADAPAEAAAFVRSTFSVIGTGAPHRVAAAFTFGREDLIPGMFREFIRELDRQMPGRVALFRYYLDRHIELDGDDHGPMALAMVRELCRTPQHWAEAAESATFALQARLHFWDGVHARIVAAQATR